MKPYATILSCAMCGAGFTAMFGCGSGSHAATAATSGSGGTSTSTVTSSVSSASSAATTGSGGAGGASPSVCTTDADCSTIEPPPNTCEKWACGGSGTCIAIPADGIACYVGDPKCYGICGDGGCKLVQPSPCETDGGACPDTAAALCASLFQVQPIPICGPLTAPGPSCSLANPMQMPTIWCCAMNDGGMP